MTTPFTEAQFGALVEQFVKEQGGIAKAAPIIGISRGYLSYALGRVKNRKLGKVAKVAAYFGLQPQVVYVKLGEQP